MALRRLCVLLAAASLALTAGCSGDDAPSGQPDQSGKQAAASMEQKAPAESSKITLMVSADKTHAVQPNDVITLTIAVGGPSLDPSANPQTLPGGSHYRVYLNEAGGDDFLAEGGSPMAQVTVPADITDGSHELRVVLVNDDGSPVDPPVQDSVLLIVYRL